MAFRVFFDANVLIPINLCDLILNLAEEELFTPLWSEKILEEVERNLVLRLGLTNRAASKRVNTMQRAFPNSLVTRHSHLIPLMTCDKKDRHVLAGTIHGQASLLVTANIRDFPATSVEAHNVEVVHPDVFLQDQLDLYPFETLHVLRLIAQRNRMPPNTLTDLLVALRRVVPDFAQFVSYATNAPEVVGQTALFSLPESKPSAEDLFYPNGPDDFTNPKTVAYRWYNAALGNDIPSIFEQLCLQTTDFPPIEDTAALLEGHGLADGVDYAIEEPRIAYMKLVRTDQAYLQAISSGSFEGMAITLVQIDSLEWRVHSFGSRFLEKESIW